MSLQQSETPVLCLEREGRCEGLCDPLVSWHQGRAGHKETVRWPLAVPGDQDGLLPVRQDQIHRILYE